jgi:hypothetical protein
MCRSTFLGFVTSWRWEVNFTLRPLYTRYSLYRRLSGPQSRSDPTGTRTPTPRPSRPQSVPTPTAIIIINAPLPSSGLRQQQKTDAQEHHIILLKPNSLTSVRQTNCFQMSGAQGDGVPRHVASHKFTTESAPRYPLDRGLSRPQSRSGRRGENSWPYRDLNSDPSVVQPAIPTTLSWLLDLH